MSNQNYSYLIAQKLLTKNAMARMADTADTADTQRTFTRTMLESHLSGKEQYLFLPYADPEGAKLVGMTLIFPLVVFRDALAAHREAIAKILFNLQKSIEMAGLQPLIYTTANQDSDVTILGLTKDLRISMERAFELFDIIGQMLFLSTDKAGFLTGKIGGLDFELSKYGEFHKGWKMYNPDTNTRTEIEPAFCLPMMDDNSGLTIRKDEGRYTIFRTPVATLLKREL